MPRPRPPPTPASSTDLQALEKALHNSDMESMFSLPPPAIRSTESHSTAREISTTAIPQSTPPFSPQDKALASSPRQKRTASGGVKSNTDHSATGSSSSSYALPPPPSRARKIIQMKPKSNVSNNPSPGSDASYQPPASAAAGSNSGPKAVGAANSKRKQPSATSAAGRKIARKTAHSIIERRRRSKMNEEFGVLKDMIPACEGVEMHKLAILQAGIEYVRYLEHCVEQLKTENDKKGRRNVELSRMQLDERVEEDEFDDEEDEEEEENDEGDEDEDGDDMAEDLPDHAPPTKIHISRQSVTTAPEWSMRDSRKSSLASSSSYPSPHILSQMQGKTDDPGAMRKRPTFPANVGSFSASPSQISIHSNVASATPTPTLLSPVFNSIHFSPDLARTQTNSSAGKTPGSGSLGLKTSSTSGSWTTPNTSTSTPKPSPNLQPLPSPKAAMHLPLPHGARGLSSTLQLPPPHNARQRERDAHSKSPGALSDGSGTAEASASAALMMLTNDWRGGSGRDSRGDSGERGKGMSVKDLLSA